MRRSSPFHLILRLSCIAWAICSGGSARAQNGVLHERQKLIGLDTYTENAFGYAVSMNGGWAIVSAPGGGPGAGRPGAAYMFRLDDRGTPLILSDDTWVQQQKLTVSAQAANGFGAAVAIDGDRVVVGVSGDDDRGFGSGSSYVFRLDDNGTPSNLGDDTWVQEAKLLAADGAAGDEFGRSVAIDDPRIVVGTFDANAAYVFLRHDRGTPLDPSDDFWVQEAKLIAPDAVGGHRGGWSVAISGGRILAGAPYSDPSSPSHGAAYVFRRDDVWVFEDKLTAPDSAGDELFGYAAAIGGDTAVIGSRSGLVEICRDGRQACATSDECAVGVCDTNGSACHADADCPQTGDACALPPDSGPCRGICPSYFYNGCTGQCELFQYGCCGGNANNFPTAAECQASCPPTEPHVCLLPPDPGTGTSDVPRFFYDPCTRRCESFTYHGSGGNANNFVLLADCEDACPPPSPPPPRCVGGDVCGVASGSVYVFRFDGAAWAQESKLTPSDGQANDTFGNAVALGADQVIVGAEYNDGGCPETDPDCATGAAYVYRRFQNGSIPGGAEVRWVQEAKLTPSDPTPYHGFSRSVATHGPYVIAGATRDHEAGFRAGAAYVFDPTPIPDKNRYIFLSLPPTVGSSPVTALRVTLVDLQRPNPPNAPCCPPQDFSDYEFGTACTDAIGCVRWVGKPGLFLESQDLPTQGNFKAARLQCTPYYHSWSAEKMIHIVGAEVMPSSTYEVDSVAAICIGNEDTSTAIAGPLIIQTARFGDVAAPFNPPSTSDQPDVTDIAQLVNKFKNVVGAPSKAIAQLQPNLPELNADINALDIVAVVNAVKGFAYPFSGPCPCPSAVTCGTTACANPTICVTTYGAGATCVKTCSGGINSGDPCINDTHCPGGACGTCFCRDRCGRCN